MVTPIRWKVLLPVAIGVLVLAAFAIAVTDSRDDVRSEGERTDTSFASPTSQASVPRGFISEATWNGGPWPFTVPQGVVNCSPMGPLAMPGVTFTADGRVYAVNGTARTFHIPPMDPIWRDDPRGYGLKINIGPVLDYGLQMCAT